MQRQTAIVIEGSDETTVNVAPDGGQDPLLCNNNQDEVDRIGGHYLTDPTGGHFLNDTTGGHFLTDPTGGHFLTEPTGGHFLTEPTGGHFLTDQTKLLSSLLTQSPRRIRRSVNFSCDT